MVSVTVEVWYVCGSVAVHVSVDARADDTTAPAGGLSAIVFRSSSDSHVRELTLDGSGWQDRDRTVSSD
ncbi:hypothetical protein [Sorangium sp. So ce1182]|uniref:hypothetical protein n=1 Tax=Sorangium sp. So ce1182 TaxID=3133334 RepID=UPI003F64540F